MLSRLTGATTPVSATYPASLIKLHALNARPGHGGARPVPTYPELVALLSHYLKKSRSWHPGPAFRLGDRHVKGIQGPAHRLRDDLVKVARPVVEGRDGRGDYRAGQRGF
jgi:hypothetical protein